MMERLLTNELSKKRWRVFKSSKIAVFSSLFLIFLIIATFISPLIANNRPLILKHHGKIFFPISRDYEATEFGITDRLDIDYRAIVMSENDFDCSVMVVIHEFCSPLFP